MKRSSSKPRASKGFSSEERGGWPVLALFDAMGRRKALPIIWELRSKRSLKFRELVEACEANPSVINARLKELRTLGLVLHERPDGYYLTKRGSELLGHLLPLWKWSQGWIRVRTPGGPPQIIP